MKFQCRTLNSIHNRNRLVVNVSAELVSSTTAFPKVHGRLRPRSGNLVTRMIPRKQTLGVRSSSITKNLTNYMMNSIKSCTRQKWLLLGASVIAAVALVIASRRLRVSSNHPQQKRSVLTIVDKNSRLSTIEKCYDKSALFLIYLMSPEMLKLQPVLEKLVEHPSRVLRCNRMENIIPLLRHMDVDELVWSAEWPEELKPGCSRYVKTISNAPTAHN